MTVASYPGGTNVSVLGTSNGLKHPMAAVDWPNAVYYTRLQEKDITRFCLEERS